MNKISDFIKSLEELKEKYGDLPIYKRRWSYHWEKYVYDKYDVWDFEDSLLFHTEGNPISENIPEDKAFVVEND